MATITTIDSDILYSCYTSRDTQIFENSSGDLVCVYARDTLYTPEPLSIRYSKDGGVTWSDRVFLFTQAAIGTGIICSGSCGGTWVTAKGGLISGSVKDDVLYLSFISSTNYGIFTKCDISDITNVVTYSNWKSANGVSPTSPGCGHEGEGYDVASNTLVSYASLTVKDSDDILIATVRANPKNLDIAHWNGTRWKISEILDLTEDLINQPVLRRTKQGDWVIVVKVDATDANDYIIGIKCNNGDDPTDAANWKSFDGLSDFDYVIDTGIGIFHWPRMEVDSAGDVHVLAPTYYAIDSHMRLFHNYWNGEEWVKGNAENAAGEQVDYNDNPKVGDYTTNHISMNVDAVGQIIVLISQQFGPSGNGLYSLFWQGGAWDFDRYEFISATLYSHSRSGQMRGGAAVSKFMLANASGTYFCGVDGAAQGCPWWEETVSPTIDELMKRLTTPYLNDVMCNNYKLLTLAAEQLDDIKCVSIQVRKASNVEEANNVDLDNLGELIACYRHTDETDKINRSRLKDYLHSLIGGGTIEQLEHTVKMAIPGITDDDFEIIDGYGTTGHGVGGHYAHIKVRIGIGFNWVINNLWEMLDRARAACITIDELGPVVEETITLVETVEFESGIMVSESLTLSETVVLDFETTISESITLSEPRAGSLCHYCDITQVDSLNYLCS